MPKRHFGEKMIRIGADDSLIQAGLAAMTLGMFFLVIVG